MAGISAGTEFLLRVLGGFAGALAILVWWIGFSRAPWLDRLGALGVIVAALAGTAVLGDPSMLAWLLWYAAPVLSLALVLGAAAGRSLGDRPRRLVMAAAIVLPCAATLVLRSAGVTGNAGIDFEWRWTQTPEQRLLARADAPPDATLPRLDARHHEPVAPAAAGNEGAAVAAGAGATAAPPAPGPAPDAAVRWAGFRGADRDSSVPGVRIETDWSASPPVPLWRRPVGPGWASFAVRGDVLYTQEQRGGEEIVSAYSVATGEPVWRHRDRVRFEEPMGGPGPRATPALAGDRVYTFGSTGILNALDAATGSVAWSRNPATDLDASIPTWGYSSSPLIVSELVIVAVGGTLAAYGRADGRLRWVGPAGGDSYSSPQLATIDGVQQVLLIGGAGTTSVTPATGKPLWTHPWDSRLPILPIVQPALLEGGGVLIGDGITGVRRLALNRGGAGWTVEELWASNRLKPYFNDFVVHRGHAYGFDGAILAAVDLADGVRKWKGGRYGQGQLLLLPDQDLLLVVSEEGELVLVQAVPDRFTELARVPALTGKTWNHPVLAGDVLLVRNGEEVAAFRLALVRLGE
jgi:outer membrane protein assembly factor BamB